MADYSATLKNGWRKRQYADLTEQWSTLAGSRRHVYLELHDLCGPGYRVVSREGNNRDVKCPPVISGPHDTLEGGKAAYLIALSML